MANRFVCRSCFEATGKLVPIVNRPFEDGSGGEWICVDIPSHVAGTYLDGGQLDLGIVRDDNRGR